MCSERTGTRDHFPPATNETSRWTLRGDLLLRAALGPAEHEFVQGTHGVLAVLAGGVDIAADIQPVLGDVVAGQAAGDPLLGLERADAALAAARSPSSFTNVVGSRIGRLPSRISLELSPVIGWP
jgi:hypothetical protein